jgi:hypothetical protein
MRFEKRRNSLFIWHAAIRPSRREARAAALYRKAFGTIKQRAQRCNHSPNTLQSVPSKPSRFTGRWGLMLNSLNFHLECISFSYVSIDPIHETKMSKVLKSQTPFEILSQDLKENR